MNNTLRPINPFSLPFGKQPPETISRKSEIFQIISDFDSVNPESNAYIFTGPREVGKTVSLSLIENYYSNNLDWIVVDLIPEMNMSEQLASLIYDEGKVRIYS